MQAAISVALLVAVLGFAVARPSRLPEAVAAVPAALLVIVFGLVTWRQAFDEMLSLAPTIGFLAAVLVLAYLAAEEGVFTWAGSVAARASRGRPSRLLGVIFLVASLTTAVLSLDATVVLLTPVVFATAARSGLRARPHVYACTHLANSASLLLPVSNLTNLLAFAATGLSFTAFASLMALPWLAVIAVEYLVFRWFFAADLATPAHAEPLEAVPVPWFALIVLAVTLAGFGAAQPFGVNPAWVAAAGAGALAAHRLARQARQSGRTLGRTLGRILAATNPAFCAFVAALAIVVLAVRSHGLGSAIAHLVPPTPSLSGLLTVAVLAAMLANLVNNLPATLILVPLTAHSPALILAVLIGVNVGPNLTYVGSLATLLWRQILHLHDHRPATSEFLRLGAATVSACLLTGVVALWLVLRWWSVT